ncbi:MAG: hypothetical protein JJU30_13305 [Alkalimonas sp.]|nr:hypothetical protein [Alkalimonas sp.]
MTPLLNKLETYITEAFSEAFPDLADAASFVLQTHLTPENYAMAMLSNDASVAHAKLKSADYASATQTLVFEKTDTMRGIIRVMVRTLLRRKRLSHLGRDSQDQTLTPRVLLPFEGEFNYWDLLDSTGFIRSWQQAIEQHPKLYDEQDKASIDLFSTLKGGQLSSSLIARHIGMHSDWATVLPGVFNGLRFLHDEYQFDANRLWRDLDRCGQDASRCLNMIKKVQNHIHQFGIELAGSFLSDLGHERFVKPAPHITHSIAALHKLKVVPQRQALEHLYQLSAVFGVSPQTLDRLFYLGYSGNFYLFQLQSQNARHYQVRFLQQLNQLDSRLDSKLLLPASALGDEAAS